MHPPHPGREVKKEKKPYLKPELRQVPLRPEEAVLGNCKLSGVSGPAAADCGGGVCSASAS
jgi:hypothetical protein